MRLKKLGWTNLNVSALCLGTMTFGEQNTQAEAFEQLSYATANGINFIDTSEMYPIIPRAQTYTLTEQYIGNWLAHHGGRDKLIIASKVINNTSNQRKTFGYVRSGNASYNAQNIEQALHASLKRLNTDYLDLYQLHWPERSVNIFGQRDFTPDANEANWTPLHEVLENLARHVEAGKIRYIGLSNETPWGLMTFLKAAEQLNLPKIATVQNPYHLLNRSYEIGMEEISYRENIALLGYSPLAYGALTGKYLHGQRPQGSRMALFPERYGRFLEPHAQNIVQHYVNLAHNHGLTPVQLAIGFAMQRPVCNIPIIGATSVDQLAQVIAAANVHLSADVMDAIATIHNNHPNPCL